MKVENQLRTDKIRLGTKIGYGFGSFGDVIAFNFFYVYFIYYLTDFAGLTPAMAGVISMITIWFDAFTDPIIGGLSDRCKSAKGRRYPYMIAGIFPLYITLILMYLVVPIDSVTFKFIYYCIIGCLFWLSYTIYVVPFLTVGAELTQDYNERNNLRSVVSIFIYVGTWFGTAGPVVALAYLEHHGISEKWAFTLGAVLFGAIALIGGLISAKSIKGKELKFNIDDDAQKQSIGSIFVEYFSMLKLRAFRFYIGMVFMFCIAYSIEQGALVYIMDNNLGLSAGLQSTYWTWFMVFSIIQLPLVNTLCNKYGKREGSMALYFLSAVGMIICFLTGIPNYAVLIVHCFFFNLGNTVYWTIGYSMMYDNSEVLEFKTGERGEGKITGMGSFVQKLSCSIGAWLLGMMLTFFRYDASLVEQSAETQNGIVMLVALIPGLLVICTGIITLLNPLSRGRYEKLTEQLIKKRSGEEVSTKGFEKLF